MYQWISVKDQLPEDDIDKNYLVTDGKEVIICQFYLESFNDEDPPNWVEEYFCGIYVDKEKITHWMPFPNPPTAESQLPLDAQECT